MAWRLLNLASVILNNIVDSDCSEHKDHKVQEIFYFNDLVWLGPLWILIGYTFADFDTKYKSMYVK